MTKFRNVSILYLDDQEHFLQQTKEVFQKKGFNMEVTRSIPEAKRKAISSEVDVLICDLKLEEISTLERGNEILKFVRQNNHNIFLAIYSAYKKDLSPAELDLLDTYDIKLYDKLSTHEFMLNLQKDYDDFEIEKNRNETERKHHPLMEEIRKDAINHLLSLGKPLLKMPVPGFPEISAKDLIVQIKRDTDIGNAYLTQWYRTWLLIKTKRSTKTL